MHDLSWEEGMDPDPFPRQKLCCHRSVVFAIWSNYMTLKESCLKDSCDLERNRENHGSGNVKACKVKSGPGYYYYTNSLGGQASTHKRVIISVRLWGGGCGVVQK